MKRSHFKLLNMSILSFALAVVFSSTSFAQTAAEAPAVRDGISPQIKTYCEKLDQSFKKYGWEKSQCETFKWNHYRNSVKGDPLMWVVYGDTSDENLPSFKDKDVTIVMCGVHGDEITPVKFCYDLMYYLRDQYADPEKVNGEFKNKVVLVSPLVNPDSFFLARPTRFNARGVDPNRNFPTNDWHSSARQIWLNKLKKDKRRNPGVKPNSEPEVVFQVNLIKRYGPDKIISVHSPLTLIDYDGPTIAANNGLDGHKAHELLVQMSKKADGYNIKDYPFFPGSLGNWAGKERNIPTYTLELPSSDSRKNKEYWALFKDALHQAIVHNLRHDPTKAEVKVETIEDEAPAEAQAPVVEPKVGEVPKKAD